jgi:Alr-MurF fusion protein
VEHNLEPEIYSFEIAEAFITYLQQQAIPQFPVHIKLDTGMHRLGFAMEEVQKLCLLLQTNKQLIVRAVFSHLVGSDNETLDDFTQQQTNQFLLACQQIEKAIGYTFIKHIANSAAIIRHPHLQMDMVRLGIGLYGVENVPHPTLQLLPVSVLKSTIAQIKHVSKGETVGYDRKAIMQQDAIIATIRIGYADGLPRSLSGGKGFAYINGLLAPFVGNVCMDMTMIDITNIDNVHVGDVVEIFGDNILVQDVAKQAGTIAYEILTGISQRVRRVYYEL